MTKRISLCRIQEKHEKSQRRCNEHKDDQEKPRKESKKTPQRRVTTKKWTDRDKDRLTTKEEKKLKDKYYEIKKKDKEMKRITKAYEELQRIKRKDAKRRLPKTVRNVLEDNDDRANKKRKSKSSSSESSKRETKKYRIKVVRVTGGSTLEERQVLTERGEDDGHFLNA